MTNRLSTWLLAAVVLVLALGLALVGFGSLLSWAALLALIQVPAVLATMLLIRACWLRARGRPTGLFVRGREVMTGVGAFVIPAAVLAVWIVGRETGTFTANLYATAAHTSTNHTWQRTRSAPKAPIPDAAGISVEGPDGPTVAVLNGALSGMVVCHDDLNVAVHVKTDYEEPAAWLPLWKSTANGMCADCSIVVWRSGAPEPLCLDEGTFTIEGSWSVFGFATRSEFSRFVVRSWAEALHKTIADRVRTAVKEVRETTAPR